MHTHIAIYVLYQDVKKIIRKVRDHGREHLTTKAHKLIRKST